MPIKTPLIRYNILDRQREYRGAKRNFDSASLAAIINGPEVQERVAKRDLPGYYGHWVRMDHGLEPPEGAVIGGKMVPLEQAFVTTHLRADDQGNIEHIAETMDNANGAAVESLIRSKAGGFSSAIRTQMRGGLDIPVSFHGFDYVREPNFSGNRAYTALDSVEDEEGEFWMLDGVLVRGIDRAEIAREALRVAYDSVDAYRKLYDGMARDHALAIEALEHTAAQNDELIAEAVRRGKAQPAVPVVTLDAVAIAAAAAIEAKAAAFKAAKLPGFADGTEPPPKPPIYARYMSK